MSNLNRNYKAKVEHLVKKMARADAEINNYRSLLTQAGKDIKTLEELNKKTISSYDSLISAIMNRGLISRLLNKPLPKS